MNEILDQMARDARTYFVPEGLPGRKALLAQLPQQPSGFWQALSPIQNFFVFETAPEYLRQAPPEVAEAAYCAAMETLPGDWWGEYGTPDSETSRRLLKIEGIERCLLRQLDNEKPVSMSDSEPATLASLEKFQVGDLAALLLSATHHREYSLHDPPEVRRRKRDELKTLGGNR